MSTLIGLEKGRDAISDTVCIKDFSEFVKVEHLYVAYKKTRQCKRKKEQEARFECHQFDGLDDISKALADHSYVPYPLNKFTIFEPKEREINAPAFPDKIVQRHMTDATLYPSLVDSIPFLSWAAQTGKGQHHAVEKLKDQLRRYFLHKKGVEEQRRRDLGLPYLKQEDWFYNDGWIVKGDIRKCFQSTNHELLKSKIYPKLPNDDFCWLLGLYIDQVRDGVALGHQTSHISVVFFVSQALRNVCDALHCKDYGMYMDDWYVIVDTKEKAKAVLSLAEKEFSKLNYELNEKTCIMSLKHGIDFCGFHVYLTKTGKVITKLRQSSKKRVKRRIRKWKTEYSAGNISKEKIEESFQAWVAHAKHGDTRELIRNMRKKLNEIFEEGES